jgi:alginate O-acetyltransferase complex protein AlgI
MLFNSISFAIFLPIVFLLYWYVCNRKLSWQNSFLLVASYTFYGWWDWRFLLLIGLSTVVDYVISMLMVNRKYCRFDKLLLSISLIVNLGLLGFFKYYNFFIESWISMWGKIGIEMSPASLTIILPVGISFYTFQTLSYTIDVYRKKIFPTTNFINFAAYVAFFPQLVAGPIERASRLLPQFAQRRSFTSEQGISAVNLIIWGLFKKVVIADNCAIYVNEIFDNSDQMNTASLILGSVYFAFQIYGDFSGYSDIAIGTARLFGFSLMKNFDYPYFSRNVAEFWRRWHISLSTWFRDYLYIPLGGSRGSKTSQIKNVLIIFIVSGFWHGANWTFIIWGFIHSVFYLPLLIFAKHRAYLEQVNEKYFLPHFSDFWRIVSTFILVTIAWIFFRANSIDHAYTYLHRLFTNGDFSITYLSIERYSIELLILITFFVMIEWFHKLYEHPFVGSLKKLKLVGVIIALLVLGVYSDHNEFIYFQF